MELDGLPRSMYSPHASHAPKVAPSLPCAQCRAVCGIILCEQRCRTVKSVFLAEGAGALCCPPWSTQLCHSPIEHFIITTFSCLWFLLSCILASTLQNVGPMYLWLSRPEKKEGQCLMCCQLIHISTILQVQIWPLGWSNLMVLVNAKEFFLQNGNLRFQTVIGCGIARFGRRCL